MTDEITKSLFFDAAYTEEGWLEPAYLNQNAQGETVSLTNSLPHKPDCLEVVGGWLLPGFTNSHSHSFQFAMAGKAEHQNAADDFWSWRKLMYQLAGTVEPGDCRAIATKLFWEMLRSGYTQVVEFHYLFRDPKGELYNNKHEIAESILAAAEDVGIKVLLVPVFYNKGNFSEPISEKQKRFFYADLDEYFNAMESLQKHLKNTMHTTGIGLHSLRAAEEQTARELLQTKTDKPFHLHISEQQKEVKQCQQAWGQSPLSWLLDNGAIDHRFNLVHATHIEEHELRGLEKAQCNVVLCPSTEGNLGDGFFPLEKYRGTWAIGTDSHVNLDFFEELRWLEYGARLRIEKRNINQSSGSTGDYLFNQAMAGGRQSTLSCKEYFPTGQAFDGIVIDNHHWRFAGTGRQDRLSSMIFTGQRDFIKGVWVNGQCRTKDDTREISEKISRDFKLCLERLT